MGTFPVQMASFRSQLHTRDVSEDGRTNLGRVQEHPNLHRRHSSLRKDRIETRRVTSNGTYDSDETKRCAIYTTQTSLFTHFFQLTRLIGVERDKCLLSQKF